MALMGYQTEQSQIKSLSPEFSCCFLRLIELKLYLETANSGHLSPLVQLQPTYVPTKPHATPVYR